MKEATIFRPLRILVVENHPDTRRMLKMYLEYLGHSVTTAATKEEAMRKAAEEGCEVLLSDIGLTDGDGWELLEDANFPRPAFAIAMSGYGAPADYQKSVQAGFRSHILKPFEFDELDALLDAATREISGAASA